MFKKRYSDEFKLQVIKEYLETSIGCRPLAKKYNLPSKNYIHNWEKQLIRKGLLNCNDIKNAKNKTYSLNTPLKKTAYEKQLERENLRLKAELAFYKELENLIDIDSKKKMAIFKLRNKFPVSLLCDIAKIDRNNFYKWLKNYNPKVIDDFDNTLINVFNECEKTYGYRRMHLAMKSLGFNQNEKFVRNRMKKLNLKCEIRQKKNKYQTSGNKIDTKCKNYLNQDFYPEKPNRYYSVDITYLNSKKGMVYLNVIIDLFGKMPIAYLSSYSCNSILAENTIDLLVNKRKNIRNAMIHSDQGVTYLSKNYIQKLVDLKVIRSNSKKGYPFDNACSENFFSIFKVEKFYRLGYIPENKEEIDTIVEEYMDFYINKRISLSLGGLTPKEFYDKYIENKKRLPKK